MIIYLFQEKDKEYIVQLSQFTDIGLKSIMYLKQSSQLVTIDEIASQFQVPRNHLIKVLNFMMHKNWIISTRGRNGGMAYNRASDELKIGDVIMIFENKDELLDCDNCILHANCSLRGMLREAMQAFYGSLNKYTFKDIVDSRTAMFINQIIWNIR